MTDFAKILRIDGQQVLFFISDDENGEAVLLNQMVYMNGIFTNIKVGPLRESNEEILTKANDEMARLVIDTARKAIGL